MILRKHRRLVVFILSVLFGLVSTLSITAWSNSSIAEAKVHNSKFSILNSSSHALELAKEGQKYYNSGRFDEAAKLWQEAALAYRNLGDQEGMTKSLINKSQALQDLGLYPKSCKTLMEVFAVENPNCSQEQLDKLLTNLSQQRDTITLTQAIGLRGLGDVLRKQGILKESLGFLQLSHSIAHKSKQASAVLLSLGNTERALGNQKRDHWDYQAIAEIIDGNTEQAALAPYQKAFTYYIQAARALSDSPTPKIQAQLNHFKLLLDVQQWWAEQTRRHIASRTRYKEYKLSQKAKDFFSNLQYRLTEDRRALQKDIESSLSNLSPSRSAVYAQINFAQSLIQSEQVDKVEPILKSALQQARNLQDTRAITYTLGYLGKLYHKQGRLSQATGLTRQALILAQEQNTTGDAREITYLWQSQLGSLLSEQKDTRGAIAAYMAAFNTLQSLRKDLNANNQDVQFDFLQQVKPVYLELADLLLKTDLNEADLNSLVVSNPSFTQEKPKTKKSENRLELARRVIESLQLAELDNFFQDPCSQEANIALQIDDIDPQAAVIYPIIFKDRLEVIYSLAQKPLQHVAIPVSENQVNDTLDRLYDQLDNVAVNNSARNILSTSNPDPEELKENIEILLPIFNQVYSWLIQPFEKDLESNKIKNLVFVMNGRLQKVPVAALYNGKDYLIQKYGIALVPSLQLIDPKPFKTQKLKVLAGGVSQQIKLEGEIFPALVNVPKELDQIQLAFPNSKKLLNQNFTATTIQKQLKSNFPVVHLATHGLFSSNPQKNFIITGDGQSISINELSTLLREPETNVELLVLSACETATGDERAVLGLAGVAVRSGARSTLATLWSVGDASTAKLMSDFYQELKKPNTTKLNALRTVQLSLIDSLKAKPPFENLKALPPHPYYWAAYTLVGNWN
ncbi:CHAT domain-containing protein [Aetokthonos hydrillicola Thurmond2011]|jgi:CHAT domain-containing protein|uniref:CHAT domain-containing protein n=1 Tax=Aetokthonos hydrillicola Thurmond2011 TaxID=2712845 RepID=A0AAP5MCB6_9CYAN|nr:CHAT domain-containing protein [Aetokthonos hydrillicola]MBO3462054.1 CHAT domain-containing protein [Aetokthonos hydrillicola CCALA 1050]MBW4589339.1 CHAT domain-containing protein [Aetokthonos hydrillicola CCALA 1050]MDR9898128.1 CHAT domain-containing protein [Aetokthonos hydrillicola Thurmond2011]